MYDLETWLPIDLVHEFTKNRKSFLELKPELTQQIVKAYANTLGKLKPTAWVLGMETNTLKKWLERGKEDLYKIWEEDAENNHTCYSKLYTKCNAAIALKLIRILDKSSQSDSDVMQRYLLKIIDEENFGEMSTEVRELITTVERLSELRNRRS